MFTSFLIMSRVFPKKKRSDSTAFAKKSMMIAARSFHMTGSNKNEILQLRVEKSFPSKQVSWLVDLRFHSPSRMFHTMASEWKLLRYSSSSVQDSHLFPFSGARVSHALGINYIIIPYTYYVNNIMQIEQYTCWSLRCLEIDRDGIIVSEGFLQKVWEREDENERIRL